MKYLIGIDLGASGTKTVLFELDQEGFDRRRRLAGAPKKRTQPMRRGYSYR